MSHRLIFLIEVARLIPTLCRIVSKRLGKERNTLSLPNSIPPSRNAKRNSRTS